MSDSTTTPPALRVSLWATLFVTLSMLLAACAVPMQPVSPPAEVLAGPLIGKTWQVEEIRVGGQSQDFAFVAPVTVSFNDVGGVRIAAAQCWSGGYDVFFEAEQHYRLADTPAFGAVPCGDMAFGAEGPSICAALMGEGATPEECAAEIERQSEAPTKAFRATTRYEVESDRLTLYGENVEMRLLLDAP